MSPAATRQPEPDQACVGAVDLARAAAEEDAGPDQVGDHVGFQVEGDRVVTHLFACLSPAYVGWRWAVTVTRASRARVVTVDESVLLPGPDSLLAPDWVPWTERVRPGDLKPGDLLPAKPDDPRLVPVVAIAGQAGLLDWEETDSWRLGLEQAGVPAGDFPGQLLLEEVPEPGSAMSAEEAEAEGAGEEEAAGAGASAGDETAVDAIAPEATAASGDAGEATAAQESASEATAGGDAADGAAELETTGRGTAKPESPAESATPAEGDSPPKAGPAAGGPGKADSRGGTRSRGRRRSPARSREESVRLLRPSRVLSADGRDEAAVRWYAGSQGPRSPLTAAAPANCMTCGFMVRLSGPLGRVFGVCANEFAPDDGKIVSVDHGCGAHSEGETSPGAAQDEVAPTVDELGYDMLNTGATVPESVLETLDHEQL